MSITYTFFVDPGHGWLRVPLDELKALGIEGNISRYSYVRGRFAYLEEDCDAGTFLAAKKEKGEPVVLDTSNCRSPSRIRNFASYC